MRTTRISSSGRSRSSSRVLSRLVGTQFGCLAELRNRFLSQISSMFDSRVSSNGTSMISLIIPPKDQISRVGKMLAEEYGTASNIKSRVNRQSVLGAITSTQQRLKLYNRVRFVLFSDSLSRTCRISTMMSYSKSVIPGVTTMPRPIYLTPLIRLLSLSLFSASLLRSHGCLIGAQQWSRAVLRHGADRGRQGAQGQHRL